VRSFEDALKIIFYNGRQKYGNSVPLPQMLWKEEIRIVKVMCHNPLKLAMIKVYKVDKVACLKHISAEEGAGLSY